MIRVTLRFAGIIFGAILVARMAGPDLAPMVLFASRRTDRWDEGGQVKRV